MSTFLPVVLAGGEGTRLWPLSRAGRPKPFLPLLADGSPFQAALRTAAQVGPPLVIGHAEHRFLAAEQAREVGLRPTLLLEPDGRGDGVALALAALRAQPDDVLVVLPAEVPPADLPTWARRVVRRCPGRWVAGHRGAAPAVDLVPVPVALAVLDQVAPDLLPAVRAALAGLHADLDFLRLDAHAWATVPEVPLAGVREAAAPERVDLDGAAEASDLASLWAAGPQDPDGNTLWGDVIAVGARRSLARAESRLVALLDVEGIAVLETDDAVLVAPVDAGERVREVVLALEAAGRDEARVHRRSLRPWGAFERIGEGHRWQAKRIVVEPGAALSLQRHQHRAEHWVVVQGRARVTCGDTVQDLHVDQSTYIPRGHVHRLENPGDEPLVILEVQTGDRLDEDDIERIEDRYGRGGESTPGERRG